MAATLDNDQFGAQCAGLLQRLENRHQVARRRAHLVDGLDDLVEHFIGKYSRGMNRRVRNADAGALAKLRSYYWPGNVRELENVVERALIVARGDELCANDFDFGPITTETPARGNHVSRYPRPDTT